MKQPVKLKDSDHYKELLDRLVSTLYDKLPTEENPTVDLTKPPELNALYGPSAVEAMITTKTYGREYYVIVVNQNNNAEFIRVFK